VQIDHIVALSYAWRHGASAWTDEQRVAYANDPLNLIAVDGPTNMGKSDDGPSDWLPENTAYLCTYLGRFVEVLAVNGLTVEPADYAVLDALSPECAA
ncbi:MAG: HNH endonuclease family protein, partial [Leifsonia sp.]